MNTVAGCACSGNIAISRQHKAKYQNRKILKIHLYILSDHLTRRYPNKNGHIVGYVNELARRCYAVISIKDTMSSVSVRDVIKIL